MNNDFQRLAQELIKLGTAWAHKRGFSRSDGLAAFIDLVAEGKIEFTVDNDGTILCRLNRDQFETMQ